MTFHYLRKGTREEKKEFDNAYNRMNNLYNQYMETYKELTKEERTKLWSLHLQAKKECEKKFEPFGFVSY